MKTTFDWIDNYPNAVTVCDTKGDIVAMNRPSAENFQKYGGADLVGTSLYDCHPEAANKIIRSLLQEERTNSYITVKNGIRKLVHQQPWYLEGKFAGLVETITQLPENLPVHQRGG